ncbi:MAG TPA: hypothetical protein ENN80_01130, partial [Candidatus Hydrogenedentes bacterium]|nr:hypothetical protein [Candidatus Hydrogenedentota bacterium]
MRRHAPRHELFCYAEGLADSHATLDKETAQHIARCPRCRREVEAIRRSLAFVGEAPEIDPSEDLTAQILMKAQAVRREVEARRLRRTAMAGLAKGVACAAAILLVAGTYFGVFLEPNAGKTVLAQPARLVEKRLAERNAGLEDLRKTKAEVQTLEAAVRAPTSKPQSLWERERRRVVDVLDADIAAALAALERNPGCERAIDLVQANIERQAEALRSLY